MLNSLQTNATVLEKARQSKTSERSSQELAQMIQYIAKADLTLRDIDKLNIIHVTGTKGKVMKRVIPIDSSVCI